MRDEERIIVATPDVLLESNLDFKTDEPLIKELVVTKDRCINPSLVDSFLRLLRNGSDDIIRQKLSSYPMNQPDHVTRISKEKSCNEYLVNELYPNWKTRTQIISFCDRQSKKLKKDLDQNEGDTTVAAPEIDPRLDPYGAKKILYDREAHYKEWKRLNTWVENNKEIESILRVTSAEILRQNCDQNAEYVDQFFKLLSKGCI